MITVIFDEISTVLRWCLLLGIDLEKKRYTFVFMHIEEMKLILAAVDKNLTNLYAQTVSEAKNEHD